MTLASDRAAAEQAAETPGRVIRSWVAGCGTGEDLWKYRDSTTVKCDERGAALVGSEGSFEWQVDLTGDEVDRLVVEGADLRGVRFELSWAAPDEPFEPQRSAAPSPLGGESQEVRFELSGLAAWHGELRRFRLLWSGTPSPQSRVTEVRVEKR